MGIGGSRSGAGRPARHQKTSAMYDVDVRLLARQGRLREGAAFSYAWYGRGGQLASIEVRVMGDQIRFHYQYDGHKNVDDFAHIITTDCNYGGVRHWFSCPCCGRRCAILYMGSRVECRKCYRLQYPSQSHDETDNIWRKKYRLSTRIGSNGADWRWTQKPKGMHQATFQRIRWDLAVLDMQLDRWLCRAAAQLLGRRF